jgi:rubrerythrin
MAHVIQPEETGSGISRRKFLIGSGALAAAAALFGVTGITPAMRAGAQVTAAQTMTSDLDVLQFALTLEHLETRLYRDTIASGAVSGKLLEYFKSFAEHEAAHVTALQQAISSMNVGPVEAQAQYNFPGFKNQNEVLDFFITVEEIGAGAYLGAAPLLQNKQLLAAAAAIHNVEAQHASTLRAVRGDAEVSPAFGSPMTLEAVLAAVAPLQGRSTAPMSGAAATTENPAPDIGTARMPVTAMASTATLVYFAETQHTSAGPLLAYWQRHGGLPMFGYPITEVFMGMSPTDGKMYAQQYYQRTRLEWHPEFKGTDSEVLLGLLGAEQLGVTVCK